MICPQCGQLVPTDATTCPSCGLARPVTTAQRCPVCGAPNATGTRLCPHCGTSRSSQPIQQQPAATDTSSNGPPHVLETAEEQASVPTMPDALSRYEQPPTIPTLTASATPTSATQRPSLDETATALAMPRVPQEAESKMAWAPMPPLTTGNPDDVPFVITSAASATATTKPAIPSGERPPDFETPDVERPTIHAPKPPLPDFDTPDIERTAIRVPKPPLPDFDTPDVEHPAIHTPKPPLPDFETPDTEHPAVHPVNANTARPVPATPLPAGSAGPGSSGPAHDLVERIFGVQPSSKAQTANTAIQRLWLRGLPPEWAVAPWISIPIGALAALVVGLIVSTLGLPLWPRAISYLLDTSDAIGANANLMRAVLSPNLLQLFLLEHGIPMSLASGSPSTTGGFSALETLPLTGLSLIPACALILAGYVAAASDFTHRLRLSMLRGALVGPVYGVLLLLVAVFGSSTVPVGQNTVIQLHPSIGLAFLAGLLWGALLGTLGSLLAIRRYHLFTTNRNPDVLAGASWGALIALGSGLLLALVALAAGAAAHAVGSVPTITAGQSGDGLVDAINALLIAIAILIVIAPVGALWLFTLGTGATLDSWLNTSGTNIGSGASSFGLLAAHNHPASVVWWLLLLIPLASYIIGGRAAAQIARADSVLDGMLSGWLMGVALSALTGVLTLFSRILFSLDTTLFGQHITTNLGIAPSAGAVVVLVLFFGSIIGALGGMSAALASDPGSLVAVLASPLLHRLDPAISVARRPWDILDAARGQPSPRTALRVLIYAAIVLAVLLGALFAVAVLMSLIASRFVPISAVRGFDGFFAGLAVAVPLLLLASAAILAGLRALPSLLTRRQAGPPILPRYPSA